MVSARRCNDKINTVIQDLDFGRGNSSPCLCTKICRTYHHIRELVHSNKIVLMYCPTADMVADVMATKPLDRVKLSYFQELIGYS